MARDPDALEEQTTQQESTTHTQSPGLEFAAGPGRAERMMPRQRQVTPLWPWLVLVALAVVAAVIYAVVS
jgi:hypothetical protein